MLEDEPQVPCLCITYQPTTSSEEFRQAQTLLLELITTRKVQKLFIDTSQMAPISPRDRVWVVTDWFTQATKAGLKAIAGLAPRQFLMHLLMADPLAKIGDSFSIQVRWFTNREEALWWLEGYGQTEKER